MRIALSLTVALLCVVALPATAKHGPKHANARQNPNTCLSSDEFFGSDDHPAVKVTLKNTCGVKFRCDIHLNVSTAMGNSLAQGQLAVEEGTRNKPATAVHLFPISGGSGGTIQELRSCTKA